MTDPWGNPLSPDDQPPAPNPAWPGGTRSPAQSPTPAPVPPSTQPPPSGTWPGQPAPPTWQGPTFDGTAIAALVCGILSITCTGFLGIVLGPTALGLGLGARRTIASANGWKKGEGMATAGIVLGTIGIILSIVYLVFLIRNPDFLTDFVNNLTTTTTDGNLRGA